MSITAVLAPTNTGKTHRAVERMLQHQSGIIGLPLRLLAREIYDRITADIGESSVALVTGEEKRVPPSPRYWVCTVESMPVSRPVDFIAVDEIQLAAHRQRGYVFTDRLLHARGRLETWFMGSETMRPLISQLVPEARINRHPRLSQLRYVGTSSLRSLPPRTAVVAFSVPQVYELAERLRQRRGGVAVVLGALSPRTRNAQVALYQSGEVQYMVATDAIGMGLNMDVDHIAFAALRKFDGRHDRLLQADELAQIAGRAGRYRSDGTFGTVTPLPELPPRVVSAIESHRFNALERLVWRNSELDMRSIESLLASLSRRPERSSLTLVEYAEDFSTLSALAAKPEIRSRISGPEAVEQLWEVCQVPDFRKLLEDSHVRLLGDIFLQLSGPARRIEADWLDKHVSRLDDISGDIDTLTRRIAFIRTWTYVSHHTHWIDDAEHWRERTRAIEDRLSDALHDSLVHRFVERQRRRQVVPKPAPAAPGSPFAKLSTLLGEQVESPAERLVQDVVDADHDRFRVEPDGLIRFDGRVIARMIRGADILKPGITLLVEEMGAGAHSRLLRRLSAWTRDLVTETLTPLRSAEAQELSPAGRGLVYQLEQGLGTVARRQAQDQLRELTEVDRKILRVLDVRMGGYLVYVHCLLAPAALVRRVALSCAYVSGASVPVPPPGAASVEPRAEVAADVYTWIGYPLFGPRAIRADMAERTHRALTDAARRGPFVLPAQLSSWLGCPASLVPDVITAFGYRMLEDGRFVSVRRRRPARGRRVGRNG